MRFTCEKSMLLAGLNITGRAAAAKSPLPVLEGILCRAGADLTLTGYNMETAITFQIDAEVTEPGECVLLPKLCGDTIRLAPDTMVTVTVDENNKVFIQSGGYKTDDLNALSSEDYPEIPKVGTGDSIAIPQNALRELISGTIFAVSENQNRPIHTGVKFEVEDGTISAIAVDGYRLARRTYHGEGTGRTFSFVVPAQSLKEVEKILQDTEENAILTLGAKHILFQVGSATLICRLLEGEFLDWRKVIPANSPVRLVTNVGDFYASVERVGVVVSEQHKGPIRCLFSNQTMELRTKTSEGRSRAECSFAGDGKDLEIGFNKKYLLDALRAIPGEEVALELTNNLSPLVMTPVDEKHDFAYMVLPVRI